MEILQVVTVAPPAKNVTVYKTTFRIIQRGSPCMSQRLDLLTNQNMRKVGRDKLHSKSNRRQQYLEAASCSLSFNYGYVPWLPLSS